MSQRIENINIRNLVIDRAVQRDLNGAWVRTIANTLRLDLLGVFRVSERADGTFVLLDGQHRKAALELCGHTDQVVPCLVTDGSDLTVEADTFTVANTSRKPRAIDLFRVAVTGGDPMACDITKILGKYGWRVTTGNSDGAFSSISAITAIYRRDRDAAVETIATLTAAFGNESASLSGALVRGVGEVWIKWGGGDRAPDPAELAGRMRRFKSPADLLRRASVIADGRGVQVGRAVVELIVAEYNKQRAESRRLV